MKALSTMVVLALLAGACSPPDAAVEATQAPAPALPRPLGTGAPPGETTPPPASSPTAPAVTTVPPPASTSLPAAGAAPEAPAEAGQPVELGDWRVRVLAVDDDAAREVLAHNQFNDPPAQGNRFLMATLELEYVGDDIGAIFLDLRFPLIGADGAEFLSYRERCGVVPAELPSLVDVWPQGVVTGNVCWQVPEASLLGLVLAPEAGFGDVVRYLAIDPAASAAPTDVSDRQRTRDPDAPLGSIANPIPRGTPTEVAGWRLTVIDHISRADDAVEAENQFNVDAPTGFVKSLTTLSFENVGSSTSSPFLDLRVDAVGRANVTYSGFDAYCGVIPNPYEFLEIAMGDLDSGNLCWTIHEYDADDLLIVIRPAAGDPYAFFSLAG